MGTRHFWLPKEVTLAPCKYSSIGSLCGFACGGSSSEVLIARLGLPRAPLPSFLLCPTHVHSLNMLMLLSGWREWGWEVYYAEAAHGGPDSCSRYQACPQVRTPPTHTYSPPHPAVNCTHSLHIQLPVLLHSGAFCFLFASRNLKIGYFSQHHVEQLDLNVSAVELLARKFPGMLG